MRKTIDTIQQEHPQAQINANKYKQKVNPKRPPENFKLNKSKKIAEKVSPEEQELFKFFSDHSECWFDGCEEMRKKYKEELDKLPPNCPNCQKGALIRKYKEKIKPLLKAHHAKNG